MDKPTEPINNITQTLETTLKGLNEKNSSTPSKPLFCERCKQNEATVPRYQYGPYVICDNCHQSDIDQKRLSGIKQQIENVIPLKYRSIESDHNKMFKDLHNISVFLTGKSGVGKTVFACALAKKHIENGGQVKFISFPAFIMQLQCSYRKDQENPFEIAENVAKFSGMLVIDDLGAEKLTDFVRQIIYFIINEREQKCLTTVITSNFSIAELDEHIDPRVSSRIAGMCKVIRLTSKDRRVSNNQ